MTTVYSVMGPAGAPMKKSYGNFSRVATRMGPFSVMGPQGAPMKQLYGSFAGKTPAVVSAIPHNLPFHVTVGKLRSF